MEGVSTNNEDEITKWNPMQEAYDDARFNQYSAGPGANLNNVPRKNFGKPPFLCFKKVPKEMTVGALTNLCKQFGRVLDVRKSVKHDFFVDFENIADMEATCRALQKNSFGLKVYIGKQNNKFNESIGEYLRTPIPGPLTEDSINLKNRNYPLSSRNPTRPTVEQEPFVSLKNYKEQTSLLQYNDPERHFLIEDDAHELERLGLHVPDVSSRRKTKYSFHTGRAFIRMSEANKLKQHKASISSGTYSDQDKAFKNFDFNMDELDCVGKCFGCERYCEFKCKFCGTLFCNIKCLDKASAKHIAICKVTKRNKTNQQSNNLRSCDIRTKEMPEEKMPPNDSVVTLISVNSSNTVFIRSKDENVDLAYFKIITEIQKAAKTFEPLKKPPLRGQIVVAPFNNNLLRAMVLNLNNLDRIKVVYLDYGNVNTLAMHELLETPAYYAALPWYVVPVILKNVHSTYMTDTVRKFMYSYLKGKEMVVKYDLTDYIADKGVYSVELFDKGSNRKFNVLISKMSTAVKPSSNYVLYRDYLTEKLLPSGENVDLIVMDNTMLVTGYLSCTLKAYACEIQKMQLDVQRYVKTLEEESYAPRVDELCIAKYELDGKWYRGRCLDLVGDGYPTIVFIDYGNINAIHIKNIRRYPTQFTYPVFVADCEIEGLPEFCEPNLVAALEELIPTGSTVQCKRVLLNKEEKFNTISLPYIIKQVETLFKPKNSSHVESI